MAEDLEVRLAVPRPFQRRLDPLREVFSDEAQSPFPVLIKQDALELQQLLIAENRTTALFIMRGLLPGSVARVFYLHRDSEPESRGMAHPDIALVGIRTAREIADEILSPPLAA